MSFNGMTIIFILFDWSVCVSYFTVSMCIVTKMFHQAKQGICFDLSFRHVVRVFLSISRFQPHPFNHCHVIWNRRTWNLGVA